MPAAGGADLVYLADQPPRQVDDVTAATLRFASGAVGTMAASSLLAGKHRAALETVSPGGLVLVLSEQRLVVHRNGRTEVRKPTVDGHTAVDREFLDAVLGRRESTRVPYPEACATHRVATAIARSAAAGAPFSPSAVSA